MLQHHMPLILCDTELNTSQLFKTIKNTEYVKYFLYLLTK